MLSAKGEDLAIACASISREEEELLRDAVNSLILSLYRLQLIVS